MTPNKYSVSFAKKKKKCSVSWLKVFDFYIFHNVIEESEKFFILSILFTFVSFFMWEVGQCPTSHQ